MIILLVSFVSAVGIAPTASDCLSSWELEDYTDSSANSNTLTQVASATAGVSTGIIGKAGYYPGTTGYMDMSSYDINTAGGEVSVSFWFQYDSKADNEGMFQYGLDGNANQNFFSFGFHSVVGDDLVFKIRSSSADYCYYYLDETLTTGTWYHLLMVLDGTTKTAYIDGDSVSVIASGACSDASININEISNSQRIILGASANADPPDYYAFDGLVDEVNIFDKALTSDNDLFLNQGGSPGSAQQYPFSSADTSHSLETNVLFEQVGDVQVNSNTYQLVSSASFTPLNSSNATLSSTLEIESSKALEMECKILVDSVDYDTESNRSFSSASVGNIYITSSKFEVTGGSSTDLELWCRRVSMTGGTIDIAKGVNIVSLLTNAEGVEINNRFIDDSFNLDSSSYTLLANTTFNTSNLSATGLSRQLVFDGEISYDYSSTGLISLYSVVNGVSSPVFNRYGLTDTVGNGGNFNIAYNLSNETEVPVLIYGKSSSSDGSVDVKFSIKEFIGYASMFNITELNSTSLTSTSWATADTIVINNSDHATGDLLVKASASTISTSGDQEVTYRLYYNGSEYSPEYVRSIDNAGAGVSVLEYLFLDIGTGLFDVELQYKVDSAASIVGGSLMAYMSGNILAVPNVFYVNASNIWNGSAITSFNVTLDSGTVFESNASGIAIVTAVNPSDLNISSSDYLDLSVIGHNTSLDYGAELHKSEIWVRITEFLSPDYIHNWTLYNGSQILINTTSYTDVFYPNPGEFNNLILHSNTGAFSDRNLAGFNVTLLEQDTIIYELLPTELNITTKNILTGATIDNFSITYSTPTEVYSHIGSLSTTNGNIVLGVINNYDYNVIVDAEGYALWGNDINKTISGNTNHTFNLYTNNSISFEVRWEENNTLITDLTNILLTGSVATYNLNTSNGTLYKDNIIDDIYSVKASLSGFDNKYYSVVVADRSHQALTIYFANNYDNVTFLFQDKNTGTFIEGVYFSMSRYINGSLTMVSSKLSDITGTVIAKYVPDTFYQIIGLKSGYTTKTFDLDPVESELYIVNMESASSQILISDGVSVSYSPKTFTNGTNNFTFIINSPLGLLSTYWINVSYPDSYKNYSGTTATGEVFDFDFSIVNPDIYDYVRVEYNFTNSIGGSSSAIFFHPINYVNASSTAWSNYKENYDDLGIFERIMIVMLVVILVAGFGYLLVGVNGSLILGLLVYVFFVSTGFIPLWTILISLFVGLAIIVGGRSG